MDTFGDKGKSGQLDVLFEKWVGEFPELAGKFIKDGIIAEDIFEKQKNKLLFLAGGPDVRPGFKVSDAKSQTVWFENRLVRGI